MRTVSIGIAGTAKNTGKTTTLGVLLYELKESNLCIGLTGIGYDGESFDNVTGLPKPRIDVYEGMIVAVAQRCLKFSRAKIETLITTDIVAPLGNIIVGRVIAPGKLVVAGPTKKSELRRVLEMLAQFGAQLTIVDGALSRIIPFAEVDGLILATGASRNSDIDALAAESQRMIGIVNLPVLSEKGRVARVESVLSDGHYETLEKAISSADTIAIDGVLGGKYLRKIAEENIAGKRFVFSDSLKLLLSDDVEHVSRWIERIIANGSDVGITKPIRVIAVTVNPYYPKYRFHNEDYEAAYVDKVRLKSAISDCTNLACYDVVQEGGGRLIADIQTLCNSLGSDVRLKP